MNDRNLFLNPIYIEKGKVLLALKTNFRNWANELNGDEVTTLQRVLDLMKEYEITIPKLVLYDFDYPLTFYRTRVIPRDSDCDLSNPINFSYPPPSSCESFQRANVPGYPVFYGALDGHTAMEELRVNGEKICENDTIFLSKWKIKSGIRANFANLTLPEIIEPHQLSAEMTKNLFREFERIFKNEEDLFKETQSLLFKETSAVFLKGSHIQSGTIAYEILYNTPENAGIKINGIIYPSVCNDFRSVNFALRPDFVDHALSLESVQKFTFKEFVSNGVHGNISYFGRLEAGKIVWTTLCSELMIDDFKIELSLDTEWTEKEINEAQCIYKGDEISLMDFCANRLNATDLANNHLKQEHLHLYEEGSESIFISDLQLDYGIAYLQLDGKKNGISTIRVSTPLFMYIKTVDQKEVLNSKK